MTHIQQKERGFTLVEVIIAIAIIGILFAAFSRLGNFGGAINKARDAKTQSFVAQIKNAVNIYYLTEGKMPDHGVLQAEVLPENDIQLPDDETCFWYGYNEEAGEFFVAANGADEWIVAHTTDAYVPDGTADCAGGPGEGNGFQVASIE